MTQPYYNGDNTENFDVSMYFSKPNIATKPSDTLPAVYDLAGENVQGVYDISESSKPKIPPKASKPTSGIKVNNDSHEWRKLLDPTELKHWTLMHRRIILVVLLIIVFVAVAVGVPLAVVRQNQGSHQNTTTLNPQGN